MHVTTSVVALMKLQSLTLRRFGRLRLPTDEKMAAEGQTCSSDRHNIMLQVSARDSEVIMCGVNSHR